VSRSRRAAPCLWLLVNTSLSILHAQLHSVWRRPPRPVLGSFHLLLPLVQISFVSVPAGRGPDHLELCKHPCPILQAPRPSYPSQVSRGPDQTQNSGTAQPLPCPVPSWLPVASSSVHWLPKDWVPSLLGLVPSSQGPCLPESPPPHSCLWPSLKPHSWAATPTPNLAPLPLLCPCPSSLPSHLMGSLRPSF
jgi:hypothetical protein